VKNEVVRQKRADARKISQTLLDTMLSRKLGNPALMRDLRNPLKRAKMPSNMDECLLESYFDRWSRVHTVYCHYAAATNDVNAMVYHVIFDESGQYILSASVDGLIKIFNKSLQLEYTIRGHKRDISILAMSSNNQHVVSVDEGGIARVWDFPSGK
jgi:WD40 repeat protein